MVALRMRVVDRSVLKLIRMWLEAPVVDRKKGGPSRRSRKGTLQGGVISPLLANIDLHWFNKTFHGKDGPPRFAKAKLVRYADDFVILAHYHGQRLRGWVERTLEEWMGLTINRDKTRVVDLKRAGPHFSHTFVVRLRRCLSAWRFDPGAVESCSRLVACGTAARNVVPASRSAAAAGGV